MHSDLENNTPPKQNSLYIKNNLTETPLDAINPNVISQRQPQKRGFFPNIDEDISSSEAELDSSKTIQKL